MFTKLSRSASLIFLAAAAVLLAPTAIAQSSSAPTIVDGVIVDAPVTTRAELDEFLSSDEPKTVVLDVTTGKIVEVSEGVLDPEFVASKVRPGTTCQATTDLKLEAMPPLATYCFYGKGSTDGNWTNRTAFRSGTLSARVKFGTGVVSGWVGPSTLTIFTATSTVVRVDLT